MKGLGSTVEQAYNQMVRKMQKKKIENGICLELFIDPMVECFHLSFELCLQAEFMLFPPFLREVDHIDFPVSPNIRIGADIK